MALYKKYWTYLFYWFPDFIALLFYKDEMDKQ
jgi:hypothetical protein